MLPPWCRPNTWCGLNMGLRKHSRIIKWPTAYEKAGTYWGRACRLLRKQWADDPPGDQRWVNPWAHLPMVEYRAWKRRALRGTSNAAPGNHITRTRSERSGPKLRLSLQQFAAISGDPGRCSQYRRDRINLTNLLLQMKGWRMDRSWVVDTNTPLQKDNSEQTSPPVKATYGAEFF